MKKNKKVFGTKPVESDDDNNDLGDYQAINSDEEDSDGILDKLNEESEESSEEEVLPIHSDSSEDEDEGENEDENDGEGSDDLGISDSDIENPEDDLPSSKAWGKKAKYFYNTNRIDSKKKFENDEEEELAKMEEMEALSIQQRLLGELEDVDLSLDLMAKDIAAKQAKEDDDVVEKDKVVVDLSQMDEIEKKNLLKKESPELLTYIEDYKRLMKCVNDELLPVLSKLKSKSVDHSSAAEFIKIFYQLIMNYCTNITFYFLLKSRKMDTTSHPVSSWISNYKEMLKESEPIYNKVIKSQIQTIMKEPTKPAVKSHKRKISSMPSAITKKLKPSGEANSCDSVDEKINEKLPQLYNELSESDNEEKESKRPITYQIAKNKGLTPHRKKELRNPRVKHRMKYRKAKIRRKGQIREPRPEIKKYAGEISGIKTNVVKSVKFRA